MLILNCTNLLNKKTEYIKYIYTEYTEKAVYIYKKEARFFNTT